MSSLHDLANKVCGALPPQWQIVIEMENGSGAVYIVAAEGERDLVHLDDATLDEQVEYALREVLSEEFAYGENS